MLVSQTMTAVATTQTITLAEVQISVRLPNASPMETTMLRTAATLLTDTVTAKLRTSAHKWKTAVPILRFGVITSNNVLTMTQKLSVPLAMMLILLNHTTASTLVLTKVLTPTFAAVKSKRMTGPTTSIALVPQRAVKFHHAQKVKRTAQNSMLGNVLPAVLAKLSAMMEPVLCCQTFAAQLITSSAQMPMVTSSAKVSHAALLHTHTTHSKTTVLAQPTPKTVEMELASNAAVIPASAKPPASAKLTLTAVKPFQTTICAQPQTVLNASLPRTAAKSMDWPLIKTTMTAASLDKNSTFQLTAQPSQHAVMKMMTTIAALSRLIPMTRTPKPAQHHAHVKVAATTVAAMNWTTSSTRHSKRCTLALTTALMISMPPGSMTSITGGTTVTSRQHLPDLFPQVNELS